jgi:hypothetical protein
MLTLAAHGQSAFEREPISYNTAPVTDPVAKLQQKLDAGKLKLEHDGQGYLAAVLKQLNIPVSSQSLVFSKTSVQREQISPQTPRALYFNDDVYVGWVRGGAMLEIASTDPDLGPIFYTLDQHETAKPKFVRQSDACIQCHGSSSNGELPALMIRSLHTDPNGQPILTAGTSRTTQESPLEQRWGGWYVTGTHGDRRHMGNVFGKHRDDDGPLDVEAGANVTSLTDRFDTTPYLSAHSDIVALMVFEHQVEAHNLVTNLNYQTRWAIRDSKAIHDALGKTGDEELSESARRRISSAGEKLLKYLLYCDEELLTSRLEGTSTFTTDFPAIGPRDKAGRSLRDFDLRTRMFKYPLSYLIYSDSFDHLPAPAKDYVYRRLWEVLSGQDTSETFKHISTEERKAILEILRDTKPGLPAFISK